MKHQYKTTEKRKGYEDETINFYSTGKCFGLLTNSFNYFLNNNLLKYMEISCMWILGLKNFMYMYLSLNLTF